VSVEAPDARYPRAVEQLCYRTIREATMNVRKHAGATAARISLCEEGDQLVGVVEDDGVGFEPGHGSRERGSVHLGIEAMADRIRVSGGEFDLVSAPGEGTRVTFRVPVELTPVR